MCNKVIQILDDKIFDKRRNCIWMLDKKKIKLNVIFLKKK
jgi:hypothetical protein